MSFSDSIRSAFMPSPKLGGMLNPGQHLYGDSIMAGGIAARLRALNVPLLDYAQPGDTAANAWRRFAYDIRSFATVILEHGTNDLTGGNNPVPYLAKMAKHAQAEGRKVIFTGITLRELPAAYSWQRANMDILSLARSLNCLHVGWHEVEYSSDDKLHPDEAMRDRMVDRLMQFL